MSTTTQQILCCVGTTVASRPTQFIMERAFATLGHDWRTVTVEIAPENFDVALRGMAAMGFRALRIYPSLGAEAARLLCSSDCATSFVGNATSAELVDSGWQCWDHSGFGMLQTLNSRLDWPSTVLVIDGDGLAQRSLLAALSEKKRAPRAIMWSRPPAELPTWLTDLPGVPTSQGAKIEKQQAANAGGYFVAVNIVGEDGVLQHPIEEVLRDWLLQSPTESDAASPLKSLVLLSDSTDLLEPLPLAELEERGLERVLALQVADANLQSPAKSPGSLAVPVFRIEPVEVLIECEAYDFRRWTGQSIDRGLIQEAYDEFNDF